MTGHDIVVVGGSAGGVESVRALVAGLFRSVGEQPETALFSQIDEAGEGADRRDRTQPVSGGEWETPDE